MHGHFEEAEQFVGSDTCSVLKDQIAAPRYDHPAGGGSNGANMASRHLRLRNLFQL